MKLETILRKLDIQNIVNEENNPIEMIEDFDMLDTLTFCDKNTGEALHVVFDVENASYEFENHCRFNDQQFNAIKLYCNYIVNELSDVYEDIQSIRDSIFDSLEWS